MKKREYRIFAIKLLTGHLEQFVFWGSKKELGLQLIELGRHGYNSIVVMKGEVYHDN